MKEGIGGGGTLSQTASDANWQKVCYSCDGNILLLIQFSSAKQKDDIVLDVDDTDSFDATAKFEACRLQELGWIGKEEGEEICWEEECEEIE